MEDVRRRDDAAWPDPALLILGSLADGPKHGYRIAEDVEAQTGRAGLTKRSAA